MRSFFIILIMFFSAFMPAAKAQNDYSQKVHQLLDEIKRTTVDSAIANRYYSIVNIYYYNQHKVKNALDSALQFAEAGAAFGKKVNNEKIYNRFMHTQILLQFVANDYKKALMLINDLTRDTARINLLLGWANSYAHGTYGVKKSMDTAHLLYQEALAVGETLRPSEWFARCLIYLAIFHCDKNDLETAKKYAARAEACYTQPEKRIAGMWYEMAKNLDTLEYNFPNILYCYEKSLRTFQALKSKKDEALILMRIADVHQLQGLLDTAEKEYLQVIPVLAALKYPEMYFAYTRIHDLYRYRGDLTKALYYAIESLKNAEANGVKNLEYNYLLIGNSYLDQGQVDKSVEAYQKGLASAKMSDKLIHGITIKNVAKAMVLQGKKEEALAFVLNASKEFILYGPADKLIMAEAKANCYYALGQLAEAEKYYGQMLEYTKQVSLLYGAMCPFAMGKFFFETNQYEKASLHLDKFLQQPPGILPLIAVAETHFMQYKIDSAHGQYNAALDHFRQYKQLNDSLFSATKSKQIAELRIQYDIEKKDQSLLLKEKDIELLMKQQQLQQSLAEQKNKDILLQQQHIDLLTQQTSLQQVTTEKQLLDLAQKEKELKLQKENMSLLKNRELLQKEQLQQANDTKKITYGGIVLLIIIVGLLYNQYRVKQRNNRTMSEKNKELEHLLEEKEWLLKEVHHRVKNNLQVVLSLLESQSAFLKDEALLAINDSQHRVQAMSLIHQKLYQSDNITTIDMDVYIPELVQYLKDSFNLRQAFLFRLEVDPVQLDVAQAIPLGLILNEAITNAIKHAFTGRESGTICISLKQTGNNDFVLDIADNGIGLPAGYEHKRKGSLGMRLMRGLSGDFNADYTIESAAGTHIRVAFSRHINVGERKRPARNKSVV